MILIVAAVIVLIVLLTVLPGWLRKRRMGEDYESGDTPGLSKSERRQKIRDWDQLDHSHNQQNKNW